MGKEFNMFPADEQFDADATWTSICQLFKDSFNSKDIDGISDSLRMLENYTSKGIIKPSTARNAQILEPLFDFVIYYPIIDLNLQVRASKVFLPMALKTLYRPDVHLSLQKVLEFQKHVFFQPSRLSKPPPKEATELIQFLSVVHYFFNEGDAEYLLKLYRDQLGIFDSVSLKSTLNLLRLFPTKCLPMIVDDLIPLLKDQPSAMVTNGIIHYFASASNGYSIKYDFTPHIRTIFNAIANVLSPKVKILGDRYSLGNTQCHEIDLGFAGGYGRENITNYAASFISLLIVEGKMGDAVLAELEEFINAFLPIITPRSRKGEIITKLVSNIIYSFNHQTLINKKWHHLKVAENLPVISDKHREEFVRIVLPFAEAALFRAPNNIRKCMLKNIGHLVSLSYNLGAQELVQFCQDNMIDPEMSLSSDMCLKVIYKLIPQLFTEEHIEDNLQRVPVFVDAAIECIRHSQVMKMNTGINILAELTQFISIPSESEIDKLSMKQRMAVTSLLNTLPVVIDGYFEHHKVESTKPEEDENNQQEASKDSDKHNLWKAYFAAFDDSIIEKEVFPKILAKFRSDVNPEFAFNLIKDISIAKPSLTQRVFVPKIIERFEKSNETKIMLWTNILTGTFVACPEFTELIPKYIEIILKKLEYKPDSSNNEKEEGSSLTDLKVASKFINSLSIALTYYSVSEWSISEEKDKGKWGLTYFKNDVKPKWYKVDKAVRESSAETIFQALSPFLKDFAKFTLKKQKIIYKCIFGFIKNIISPRGKFGRISFNTYKEESPILAKIEKELFESIGELIKSLTNYQSRVSVLNLLKDIVFINFQQLKSCTSKEKFCVSYSRRPCTSPDLPKSTRFSIISSFKAKLESSKFFYSYKMTENVEKILDIVYPLLYSEYSDIYKIAGLILNTFTFESKRIQEEFAVRQLIILEDPEKTEEQCKGALRYLTSLVLFYILKSPALLSRLFRALVSMKYNKAWKINIQLNLLLNSIEAHRPTYFVAECPEWRSLVNDIIKLPRSIDEKSFLFILRFIIFQDPAPSEDIVRFLVNSATCVTDANRLISIQCLTNLCCRMKPIAPRKEYSSPQEFKKGIPFLDKSAIGFYCKADHYVFYEGPSVFSGSSVTEKRDFAKYEEGRNTLIKMINEKIISQLFDSIALLHPSETNPAFNNNIKVLWKSLGQILKSSIIDYTKNKMKEIVVGTPIQVVSACEAVSGLARAIKHWTDEEKKRAIDEVLRPACEQLILRPQANDVQLSIVSCALSIVGDLDYRRNLWLYEIIEKGLRESTDSALRNVMNVANVMFVEGNSEFDKEFIRIMREVLIPKFKDLKSFKLDDLSFFAQLFACRIAQIPRLPELKENEEEKLPEWTLLPFEVFDENKEKCPELVALIISEIFANQSHSHSVYLPQIAKRFKDICIIDSKLANITSGKFLHYGKNIEVLLGFLEWEMRPKLLDNVLEQIQSVRESLPWNSRLNLVGFLHSLTFSHMFLFDKEKVFKKSILETVLPAFLTDDNLEVRTAAQNLLKTVISIVYSGKWNDCAEFVLQKLKSRKKNEDNDGLVGVSMACALLANISIWTKCPEWLPEIFGELESIYNRGGKNKEEIKVAASDFWTRHQGREISEIEDYHYAFSGGYYS